jgi:hypothetical protein
MRTFTAEIDFYDQLNIPKKIWVMRDYSNNAPRRILFPRKINGRHL